MTFAFSLPLEERFKAGWNRFSFSDKSSLLKRFRDCGEGSDTTEGSEDVRLTCRGGDDGVESLEMQTTSSRRGVSSACSTPERDFPKPGVENEGRVEGVAFRASQIHQSSLTLKSICRKPNLHHWMKSLRSSIVRV